MIAIEFSLTIPQNRLHSHSQHAQHSLLHLIEELRIICGEDETENEWLIRSFNLKLFTGQLIQIHPQNLGKFVLDTHRWEVPSWENLKCIILDIVEADKHRIVTDRKKWFKFERRIETPSWRDESLSTQSICRVAAARKSRGQPALHWEWLSSCLG